MQPVQPDQSVPSDIYRVTILGSGTSNGVPAIGCDCPVCTSPNPKDRRRRACVRVQRGETSILIDTPPDLRESALAYDVRKVDGVLFTHEHADHIFGCDDLRPYNYINGGKTIPAYGHPRTIDRLRSVFDYFEHPIQKGGGVPHVAFTPLEGTVRIGEVAAEAVPVYHGKLVVYGYRIGCFAYVNDTNRMPDEALERLQGLDTLFLDALRHRPHETHFTVEEAVEVIQRLAPRRAYLVHMTHDLDHDATNAALPEGIELAYDGLVVDIPV